MLIKCTFPLSPSCFPPYHTFWSAKFIQFGKIYCCHRQGESVKSQNLELTKLKAFADKNSNIAGMILSVKPRLHRAIVDKSVVFLSEVGMEQMETDLPRMSHIVTYSQPIKS